MTIPKRIILLCSILLTVCGVHVSGECSEEEESLLLRLKASSTFDSSKSVKLVTWNRSSDCCYWKGVACSEDGRVVGLDLSGEGITDGLNDSSSSLFGLGYLKSLNLASNKFGGSPQIPSRLNELVNLTYLNLSSSGFSGQIPIGMSRLRNLVVLDLSFNKLKLEKPNLRGLLQNLSELQELRLDGVNISMSDGDQWGDALSSSLPNLKVLSLSYCDLRGSIHSSLSKLTSLTYLDLDSNNFSAPIPSFFANFDNLTALSANDAGLNGMFPQKVFQIPSLKEIHLSNNPMLQGSLPENGTTCLEALDLRNTSFSGRLPDSIGALRYLSSLDLSCCSFSGLVPESFSNLTQLAELDLSHNSFWGSIPSFSNLTSLAILGLSDNSFSGSVPSFSNHSQLTFVDLSNNSFSGPIPSFSQSRKLFYLDLSHNNLSGSILNNSTHWETLSRIWYLGLHHNSLTGTIPSSLFFLPSLALIDLSHNLFTDIGIADDNDGLTNHSSVLISLELSCNEISGKLPNNLFRNLEALQFLNLSYNSLEDLGTHDFSNSYNLFTLDLSHNRLQGELPIFPPNVQRLDYSVNNFNTVIPDSIGTYLSHIYFLSLASNNLQGSIPESICKASSSFFDLLDLSNNSLSGTIPPCLVMLIGSRQVVKMGMNNLSGTISDAFPANCSLQTLNLNGNHLKGHIPESLANCRELQVLDLGNNQFSGTFPCGLRQIFNLSVLILRSNEFRGGIECLSTNGSWPMLQIVDVAANNFSGSLQPSFFGSWKAMMAEEAQSQSKAPPSFLQYQLRFGSGYYYQDSVTVIGKGNEMKLEKILTIFTSIDFSYNNFEGSIPGTIGQLRSLVYLNFSGNGFAGHIPTSFGSLAQLESLDLSSNKLTGNIPGQLSGLTFLSFLNFPTTDSKVRSRKANSSTHFQLNLLLVTKPFAEHL